MKVESEIRAIEWENKLKLINVQGTFIPDCRVSLTLFHMGGEVFKAMLFLVNK